MAIDLDSLVKKIVGSESSETSTHTVKSAESARTKSGSGSK